MSQEGIVAGPVTDREGSHAAVSRDDSSDTGFGAAAQSGPWRQRAAAAFARAVLERLPESALEAAAPYGDPNGHMYDDAYEAYGGEAVLLEGEACEGAEEAKGQAPHPSQLAPPALLPAFLLTRMASRLISLTESGQAAERGSWGRPGARRTFPPLPRPLPRR